MLQILTGPGHVRKCQPDGKNRENVVPVIDSLKSKELDFHLVDQKHDHEQDSKLDEPLHEGIAT